MNRSFLLSFLLFSTNIAYSHSYEHNLIECLFDLDLVIECQDELLKLNMEKVLIYKDQLALNMQDSWIVNLPKVNLNEGGLYLDKEGVLLLCKSITEKQNRNIQFCSKKETNTEASKHYDDAASHGMAFLGHTAAAAASIEVPPLAIFETYNAVQSLKKMADEYLKAWDIEHNSSAPMKSDWRDHEDNSQAGGSNNPYEQNR